MSDTDVVPVEPVDELVSHLGLIGTQTQRDTIAEWASRHFGYVPPVPVEASPEP